MQIRKLFTISLLLVMFLPQLFSQREVMIHEGQIDFEKRVNVYGILDAYYSSDKSQGLEQFVQQYKSSNPQFKTTYFSLLFNDKHLLYQPNIASQGNLSGASDFLSVYAAANSVYTDFSNHVSLTLKKVFEDQFLVKDSTRKIQWKITDENRKIAGFSCRRANAIIMDSVYVVAFYTDQIVPQGGPESFTGLPGMILGIALPYEHTTWFATNVVLKSIAEDQFHVIMKGKETNNRQLLETIQANESLKAAGRRRDFIFKMILL